MMKNKIGICGGGYVGKSIIDLLKPKFPYFVLKEIDDGYNILDCCNVSFICVPTEKKQDGSCDTSIVEEAVSCINSDLIIIKSTIPPGTTERLAKKYNKNIVFSPEYVGEGGYPVPFWDGVPHPTDIKKHSYIIFGGLKKNTIKAIEIYKTVMGPFCTYAQTDSTTAELVKYMENCWLATKVTFCNEFYDIAKTCGVDYNELRELWLLDGRIGSSHTVVYKDNRGFGGKCLPKDTEALFSSIKDNGYRANLLETIIETNKKHDK
jgi:UDPglucose 6-dehydrogenase